MTHVYQALGDLSRNLRGGLNDLGKQQLAEKQLGLAHSRMNYDMARQDAQDRRADARFAFERPGLELQAGKAQAELGKLNRPLTFAAAFNTPDTMEHALWSKDGSETLFSKVEKLLGAKLDTTEGSKTYSQFVKPDGSVMTFGEARAYAPEIQALVFATTDIYRDARGQRERLQMMLDSGQGDPAEIRAKLKHLDEFDKSPEMQLGMLREQYSRIQSMQLIPPEDKAQSLARIEKQMDRVQQQMNSDRDYQLGRDRMSLSRSNSDRDYQLRKDRLDLDREKAKGDKGKDPAMVKSAKFIFDVIKDRPENAGKTEDEIMMEAWDAASAKKEMSRSAYKRKVAFEYTKQGYTPEEANKMTESFLKEIWPIKTKVPEPKSKKTVGKLGPNEKVFYNKQTGRKEVWDTKTGKMLRPYEG